MADPAMKLVIRFGGSVIASPLNPKLIGEYTELLKKLKDEGYSIVAVTGGGEIARQFIKAAKSLGLEAVSYTHLTLPTN